MQMNTFKILHEHLISQKAFDNLLKMYFHENLRNLKCYLLKINIFLKIFAIFDKWLD